VKSKSVSVTEDTRWFGEYCQFLACMFIL